jgi:hypothetical protein
MEFPKSLLLLHIADARDGQGQFFWKLQLQGSLCLEVQPYQDNGGVLSVGEEEKIVKMNRIDILDPVLVSSDGSS